VFLLVGAVTLGVLSQEKDRSVHVVSFVVDGDTFGVVGGVRSVRIRNVDAPELDARSGVVARDFLVELIGGEEVVLSDCGRDVYGRDVCLVRVGGLDVGELLMARGLARAWRES
jgi:endonuclease YncB( thermonuclease family)